MKYIRYIGLFTALICSVCGARPQGTPQQILRQAEQAVYGSSSAIAEFTSTYYDHKGKEQSQVKGRMYLRGEEFRLEYGDITAVYSGQVLTHYNASEETLTISQPSSEELLQINPLYFLRSRAKGYTMQVQPASKSTEIIRFTPQTKSEMKYLEIGFARQTSLPREAIVESKDGAKIVIHIDRLSPAQGLSSTLFRLSAKQYPGCEVIDMR